MRFSDPPVGMTSLVVRTDTHFITESEFPLPRAERRRKSGDTQSLAITCGLRISAPGRFEYRSVDSMLNPYLMAAALLKAFDNGIKRNLDPGEPEQRSLYEVMDNGKQVKKLPMSLGEALDCLAADEVIQSALPGDMYRLYKEYKIDEWKRFMATVNDWDMETYLDCLP